MGLGVGGWGEVGRWGGRFSGDLQAMGFIRLITRAGLEGGMTTQMQNS